MERINGERLPTNIRPNQILRARLVGVRDENGRLFDEEYDVLVKKVTDLNVTLQEVGQLRVYTIPWTINDIEQDRVGVFAPIHFEIAPERPAQPIVDLQA